ncbi:hypothetical protein [Streptomyces hirsutus]|nr:hypothetical protein [Streptomyces hirsutus]
MAIDMFLFLISAAVHRHTKKGHTQQAAAQLLACSEERGDRP